MLKLVANNPESFLQRRAALVELDWATRRLASNFLAVAEGTGKPGDLLDQIVDVAAAIGTIDGFSHDQAVANEMQAVLHAAIRQSADTSGIAYSV